MTMLKGGLIQMSLKGDTSMSPEKIRDAMIEAHLPLIEEAGQQGRAGAVLAGGLHPALFLPEPGRQMVCRRPRKSRMARPPS